jgi:hypothetical protein
MSNHCGLPSGDPVLRSSPSESRGTAGRHGSRRAAPMGFTWNGSGNASDDRSSVLALRERRVAGRLAFPASSLALPRARLAPANDGPSRSSTARRRSTSIAASGSSTHSSAPLRSPCLLPGPTHAGLLSWGRTNTRLTPGIWPLAPPSALHLLAKDRPRVHSRPWASPSPSASGNHPEVLFRPRGFSPPRRVSPRSGSQACCILQPTLGFAAFHAHQPKLATILATRPPLEGCSHPLVVLRSPGALAPVAFALERTALERHC